MIKSPHLTFLTITILLSLIFLGVVVSPFITTLVLAAILVTGAYPIYNWVLIKVKHRKRPAAIIMSLSMGIIFSIAFVAFIVLLSQEAVSTYQGFEEWIRAGKLNLNEIILKANKYINGLGSIDITTSLTQAAQSFSGTLVTQSTNLLKGAASLILNFFLLVFAMYFFFKDGESIVSTIEELIPLPRHYGQEIFQKFRQVSLAMLYGIFFTAIVQGILGGIGLAVAGIDNPIFWGTLMGIFGMLPVGGTGIIWLPASIFLFATEHYFAGIGLLLWGGLIVAFMDNLIKPMVIAKQARIYPLATFLVVIGGLMVFGLKGAILAPMVLAALMSLLHIYKLEKA
ncbi:AI-2E family transporter [Candidatus Peregrinibacteria bacterium]|nr:AI-2E family transporter [Candidatus Peregrinibacteria bacterium]